MSLAAWSQIAERDVEEIYEWIAHRDGQRRTAKKVIRELRKHCDDYAKLFAAGAVIGTARTDLGEDYRIFTHKRWVIVFRSKEDGIEIMRVLDGSRDYPRLFHE